MKIVCVTGNRPQNLRNVMKYGDFDDPGFMEYIESMGYEVEKHLKDGYGLFISGGAIGVDLDFAEMVLHLKEKYESKDRKISLEIAIPCKNQDLKWRDEDKAKYRSILEQADIKTQVGQEYTFDCMLKRNMYMVDKADKVIAFWNGEEKGGTWNTIQYARKMGKEVEIVNLKELCS